MNLTRTGIEGVLILEPMVFGDERGFFMETFNQKAFDAAIGAEMRFLQDNHSRSAHGVLRGLHYQLPPHAQGKLVRVAEGAIFDVAVDLRRSSATFGRWVGVELSSSNRRQVWIPPGFAHGFAVLSKSADVLYKTTDYYAPSSEACIRWNDEQIGIVWPLAVPPILSSKDRAGLAFTAATHFD
jgi:dTDP-4-dehydrorhamnose 3,5-epimerase